jgi:TolA-binding protein
MKRNLLGVVLLLAVGALGMGVGAARAADAYPILGMVMLADGRAVEAVAIYVDGAPAAYSDQAGMYMVPAASPGTHRVQPVKAGMTFVPAWVEVTLPPEALGVNFTAYEASGGADSTSGLEAAPLEKTPWQELWDTLSRLSRALQQAAILVMVLSLGAFLALVQRRLRSGEWSLAHLFQPMGTAPSEPPARQAAENGWEMLEAEPDTSEPGVEPLFEVVTAVSAPEAARPRPAQPAPAAPEPAHEPAPPAEAEPEPEPPAEGEPEPPTEVEPGTAHTEPAPEPEPPAEVEPGTAHHAPDAHLRVRRYAGAAPAEPQPAPPVQAQGEGAALLAQGKLLVRQGDYAGGETLLRQVIQLAPGSADAWLWLGAARLNQGDVRTARGCFLQARRLGHPQAEAALSRIQ